MGTEGLLLDPAGRPDGAWERRVLLTGKEKRACSVGSVRTMGLQRPFLCEGKRASEGSVEKHDALKDQGGRLFGFCAETVSSEGEKARKQGPRLSLALGEKP